MSRVILRLGKRGFTVVEMMIATMVFSTVLLVIAIGIMQFTRVFYKGVTEANMQDTTRTIVDQISQSIQLAGGVVTVPAATSTAKLSSFCIGGQRYSYYVGKQLIDSSTPAPGGSNKANHVFYYEPSVAGCSSGSGADINTATPPSGGREMLTPGARVVGFSLTQPSPNVYRISIRAVYGDDDLLCTPNVAGSCSSSSVLSSAVLSAPDAKLQCKNIRSGTQFCSVSEVTTVVTKRVK